MIISLSLILVFLSVLADAFFLGAPAEPCCRLPSQIRWTIAMPMSAGTGFGAVAAPPEKETAAKKQEEGENLDHLDTSTIKNKLLDLLPRMTGTREESRKVEAYVNTLEARYTPVQTLDFLNLAMGGDWQLLFSTNLTGGPKPTFRVREMFQRVEPNGLSGSITNQATWDLAVGSSSFDASGTFSVKCSYKINQGARMVVDLDDHVVELARGSRVPDDVQALISSLHRAMPKELFDPNDHAMDTTFLDGDLRIVRMTGPRFEGVRDIFIRRGSMEINPVGDASEQS